MTSEIIGERMIIIKIMMIRSDHRHKRPIEKVHHFHCVHFHEFPKKKSGASSFDDDDEQIKKYE